MAKISGRILIFVVTAFFFMAAHAAELPGCKEKAAKALQALDDRGPLIGPGGEVYQHNPLLKVLPPISDAEEVPNALNGEARFCRALLGSPDNNGFGLQLIYVIKGEAVKSMLLPLNPLEDAEDFATNSKTAFQQLLNSIGDDLPTGGYSPQIQQILKDSLKQKCPSASETWVNTTAWALTPCFPISDGHLDGRNDTAQACAFKNLMKRRCPRTTESAVDSAIACLQLCGLWDRKAAATENTACSAACVKSLHQLCTPDLCNPASAHP